MKKILEKRYLNFFLNTENGIKWKEKNKIIDCKDSEEPDFIFVNIYGKKIGMELRNLIIESPRQRATATLNRVIKNVCLYFFKKEHKFFTVFCSCDNGLYDELKVEGNKLKQVIIKEIENDFPENGVEKNKTLRISQHTFQLHYSINNNGYMFPGVPDGGIVNTDPLKELQDAIEDKNNKIKQYIKNCEECVLLIIADNMNCQSNFFEFTNKTYEHKFVSKFKNTFLLEVGGKEHLKATQLNVI